SAYRPQIEEASVQVEVVYPDTATFNASSASGALSGSAVVSVVAVLPALPNIPGGISVNTGDASGRVRGTLRATVDAGGTSQVSIGVSDPITLDLALPGVSRPDAPIVHLALESIDVVNGARAGTGTFGVTGAVLSPALAIEGYFTSLITQLGLPSQLS